MRRDKGEEGRREQRKTRGTRETRGKKLIFCRFDGVSSSVDVET
jgi:hypothetical protein